MPKLVIANCEDKMNKAIDSLAKSLQGVRTGKANPAILNGLSVSYYGMPTPINQMAQISASDPQTITIKPYDKTVLKEIEKAILIANLGLNPTSDGEVVRVHIAPLTEQTRKDLVKQAKKLAEDSKVAIRNIRREGMEQLKKIEKDGQMSEDELKRYSDDLQKMTDKYIVKVDDASKDKEKAIMSI